MQASDIMTTPVLTVGPDETVSEIARIMLDNRISALPVLAADGTLTGIVSEGDLLRRVETGTEGKRSWWLRMVSDPADEAHDYIKSHGKKASDVMSTKVITVVEDTSIADIAELLEERGIKRVPVMRGDRMVGVVSRANLLRAMIASQVAAVAAPTPDDRTLRADVTAGLRGESWANVSGINVIVSNGVVHLWGLVDSEEERRALRIAIEAVPGVKGVVEHLGHTVRAGGGL